jgi:hypothetical protein
MPTNDIIIDIARNGVDYVIGLKLEQNLLTQEDLLLDRLNNSTWSPERILNRIYSASATDRNSGDFMDIANTLEGWLFPQGPLRDKWEDLATTHTHQNLRLWLYFPEESPLAALPWELAKTPQGTRLGSTCGICRWVAPIQREGSETVWPLRILLLAGDQDNDGSLGIHDEMDAIQRALLPFGRSIEVFQLSTPTRQELSETVSEFKPHVLHFAGHGSATTSGEQGLKFDVPPPQGSWHWTGRRILPDLQEWGCVPRFVFLNACRTAGGDAGSRTAQQSFMEAGSCGAIAMQADMPGDLAGVFAATFYQKLMDGLTVSEASRMARRAILDSNNEDLSINYAIPRVEVPPGLRLLQRPTLPHKPGFEFCDEFSHARFFGNCTTERRKATEWFNPLNKLNGETTPQSNPVLLISGEARSGKSHFLKWCMETWSLGEARIRYIELHERSMTFLDVLRQIRLGESDLIDDKYKLLHSPLPPGPFKRYRWELENLLTKGVSGEWKEEVEEIADLPHEGGALPAIGDKRLEPDIAACFREALETAAEDKPLLLVFDRFSGGGFRRLPTEDFKQLVEHLFKPLAANPTSNVKLVFCATSAEIRDFGLINFPQACRTTLDLPAVINNDDLIKYAVEADFFKHSQVEDIARLMLDLPDDSNSTGLGRLGPLRSMLVDRGLTWERML